jgi:fatty acid desaturase
MTINSDLKQKEKQANQRYERQWQRQQTVQTIKGFLAVAIFIGAIMLISWTWAVEL